jgi:thymidylate kinase
VRNGGRNEIFEQETFLERVRENYLRIADERFLSIGGLASPDKIHETVLADFIKISERRK